MQTTWNRIVSAVRAFMDGHGMQFTHYIKVAAVLLSIALALEVFVFNFNFWSTSMLQPVDMASRINLPKNPDGTFRLTEANHVIEFSNLNKEVKTIFIEFVDDQYAQQIEVNVEFTDSAHQTFFNSTEYAAGVPTRTVTTHDVGNQFLKLSTVGLTDGLRLEFTGEDVYYPIDLVTVYLNEPYPFYFYGGRFFIAFAVLCLIYMFRPKSTIYHIHMVNHPRAAKLCTGAATLIEIGLISAMLFTGNNMVGVATHTYNNWAWDKTSVITTYEVGGENSQQYAMLAESFSEGKLYLNVDPPEWLKQMDNPYDKGARDEFQKTAEEGILWDTAYYDGHYYVYFGVVPVVVFYLPYYLLTGGSFPTAVGVWLAAIAFILGCTALLDRFARYHFKRVNLGLYLLLQVPLVFCCGIVYLVKFPTFYSLPIMMALAFSMWGLYLWMRGRHSKRPWGWYLGGSLCMALVIGCRPQLVLLSVVAFPLFWRRYITERRITTKRGAIEFLCLIAPYLVVGVCIMLYNHARFGSYFDFGSNYNLTTNDMTRRGWDVGRLAPALFAFFFQTPCTSGVFPYLQAVPFQTMYMGQTIKEVTFGGIFACLPILWVLPFAARGVRLRVSNRATHTTAGVVCVLLASGIIIALLDAEMAGILQRYYADFSVMFLMVSVLTIFVLNESADHSSTAYQIGMKILPVLVAFSLIYMVLLFFVPETGWYSSAAPYAYQSLIRPFIFWA